MSNFFTSGAVDTSSVDRRKLPEGTYRIELADFADYMGATNGDRTQVNFTVVEGPQPKGTRGSHVVMHAADAQWKKEKARGEIASMLGAFLGFNRDQSGLKITGDVFLSNTRTVTQANGKTTSTTRSADELPILGKQAYLVVLPYFDKKSGQRKVNPKTKQLSVTYEILPLSAKLSVTTEQAPTDSGEFPIDAPAEDDAPPPVTETDALELALADGWKVNPNAPAFFFKKNAAGVVEQLKEPALRAKYGA